MQLNLRHGVGHLGDAIDDFWNDFWAPGSGEVATEGGGLPGGALDFSSGEVDPSLFFPAPGFNIQTEPGVELSPVELAAEQTRARDWISHLPATVNVAGKLALSAAEIAAGLSAGALKPSSTCPSGYLIAGGGACVQTAGAGSSGQLVPGIQNQTLVTIALGALALMVLSGGRRR